MSRGTRPAETAPDTVLEVLGAQVGIRCDDPVTADLVRAMFAECVVDPRPGPDATPHPVVTVTGHGCATVTARTGSVGASGVDPLFEASAGSRPAVLGLVHAAVNAVAVQASPHLLVHAAVVVRDGEALVLPAASGTGKSTLAVALLRRGWGYASDEAACLPWHGGPPVSVPYPRPVALSPWSQHALGLDDHGFDAGQERLVRAGDVGAGAARVPVPVSAVVLVERGPAGTGPDLVDVSRAEVLTELLARSFNHFRDPAAALDRLADLAEGCRVARLRVGAPDRTAAVLERWWDGG